ncbi:MAG: hypothetical protein AB1451_12345 [Nitrospirota bacterium]
MDSTTQRYLKGAFDEMKACSGFEQGSFQEMTVVLMPPIFPCPHYAEGCSGEYIAPTSIKVGSLAVWNHEVLHYLLYLNTGSADPGHQNPLFDACTPGAHQAKPLAF